MLRSSSKTLLNVGIADLTNFIVVPVGDYELTPATEAFKKKFVEIVQRCLEPEASMRPSAHELQKVTGSTFQIDPRKEARLVDNLVHRLEVYSHTLEDDVAIRTENLLAERKKCDTLLREILPR